MDTDVVCSCHTDSPRARAIFDPRAYARQRAKEMGVDPFVLLGPIRLRYLVAARMQVAKELRSFGLSLPEIGHAMNRHHTSIMNLLRTEAKPV